MKVEMRSRDRARSARGAEDCLRPYTSLCSRGGIPPRCARSAHDLPTTAKSAKKDSVDPGPSLPAKLIARHTLSCHNQNPQVRNALPPLSIEHFDVIIIGA